MSISVFDLFKIGIGPSSSHTVGPMKAARMFVQRLDAAGLLARVARVEVQLYGSLGATGRGHGSDKAVILGLQGHAPDTVDVDAVPGLLEQVRLSGRLRLDSRHEIAFDDGATWCCTGAARCPSTPTAWAASPSMPRAWSWTGASTTRSAAASSSATRPARRRWSPTATRCRAPFAPARSCWSRPAATAAASPS